MTKTIFGALALLLASAVPAMAQDPGAAGTTPPPTESKPAEGGSVQIDVTPLIKSLIKKATRPRPAPAVPASEAFPGAVPDSAAGGAPTAPVEPEPADPALAVTPAVAPAAAVTPTPTAPVQSTSPRPKPPRPSAVAPAAAPAAPGPPVLADPPPAVPAEPKLDPAPQAPTPPVPQPGFTPAVQAPSPPIELPQTPEPVAPNRSGLLYGVLAALALLLAAGGVAFNRRRLVRRTQSLLRLEPRLDLGRGQCSASGLAFATGVAGDD